MDRFECANVFPAALTDPLASVKPLDASSTATCVVSSPSAVCKSKKRFIPASATFADPRMTPWETPSAVLPTLLPAFLPRPSKILPLVFPSDFANVRTREGAFAAKETIFTVFFATATGASATEAAAFTVFTVVFAATRAVLTWILRLSDASCSCSCAGMAHHHIPCRP